MGKYDYMADVQRVVKRWLDKRANRSSDIASADLYAQFCAWFRSSGERMGAPSLMAFGRSLRALGYSCRKSNGRQLYIGL